MAKGTNVEKKKKKEKEEKRKMSCLFHRRRRCCLLHTYLLQKPFPSAKRRAQLSIRIADISFFLLTNRLPPSIASYGNNDEQERRKQ